MLLERHRVEVTAIQQDAAGAEEGSQSLRRVFRGEDDVGVEARLDAARGD
jgi:hypothetical protein